MDVSDMAGFNLTYKKGIWVWVDHCVPQALHALYQQSSIG